MKIKNNAAGILQYARGVLLIETLILSFPLRGEVATQLPIGVYNYKKFNYF